MGTKMRNGGMCNICGWGERMKGMTRCRECERQRRLAKVGAAQELEGFNPLMAGFLAMRINTDTAQK